VSNGLVVTIVFVVTFLSSLILIWRGIGLFTRLGLVDQPGPQRVHKRPVPRGLGTGIYLAFLIGIALTYIMPVARFMEETERILLMVIGATIVVAVMLVDDAIDLDPLTKLAWQILAAAIVVLPGFRGASHGILIESINVPVAGTIHIPLLIAVGGTFLWLVGMMNVMNWVDGIDGLAGSVTLVSCAVLFVHTYWGPGTIPQYSISFLPLILGAAVLGFLPFNWHPAKAIMGDAGAMFLGYALGIISIIGGAKIATALLVLGLPLLDGIWVTVYRVLHGRSPSERDMGHLHHRLLAAGLGQRTIVLLLSGTSALFGALALLLPNTESKAASLVLIGVVMLGTIAWLAKRPAGDMQQASGTDPDA